MNPSIKVIGTLMCKSAELKKRPTFMEYLFGGCNLSMAIAIDFTASNGEPSLPSSLHNINPGNFYWHY